VEDHRWIYLIILLQAVLLGTVLFFGDTLFHSSVESSFAREASIRETGSSLLREYMKRYEDRGLPPESRLTGFLIENMKVHEESNGIAILTASISIKPLDIGSCKWNSLGSREGNWIKDIRISVYLEEGPDGNFSIVRTVPSI